MEANTATIVAIVSAVIAGLALLWGIYTHLSTRKVAKLTYEGLRGQTELSFCTISCENVRSIVGDLRLS